MPTPLVLFESYGRNPAGRSFHFVDAVEEITATTPAQIIPALQRIAAAAQSGLHAAGFVTYEAAPAGDPLFRVKAASELPLLWFGLFKKRRPIKAGEFFRDGAFTLTNATASLNENAYCQAVEQIREHIAAGDTYQVNFTLRQRAQFAGDDLALYHQLCRNQRADYCAYLNLGRYRILSLSPELFFHWQHGQITTKPMKGTRPRGRYTAEDHDYAAQLQSSPKERAENLMIVDLLRNDLGRIAELGSVQTPQLFAVERYETVLQMTSTVTARPVPPTGFVEIWQALFPCGSVTGAPKIRTMEIIHALEDSPRQIYTGALGFLSPGPEAVFNVAIRTLLLDTQTGRIELGLGSGITYDSSPAAEYKECLLKGNFIHQARPDFSLFETLRYENTAGYFLLNRHLARLVDSADYFGFKFDESAAAATLQEAAEKMTGGTFKLRLQLERDGAMHVWSQPLTERKIARVALARAPVDSRDVFLFHKTTHREIYTTRRASRPEVDDVLLINEKGELTESTIANLAVRLEGKDYTPPVACGLLAGTLRAELLAQNRLSERVLYPEDLKKAEAIFLLNAVRGWMPVQFIDL